MNNQKHQQSIVMDGIVTVDYEREALLRCLHGLDLLICAAAVELANFRGDDLNSMALLFQFKADLYERLVLKNDS